MNQEPVIAVQELSKSFGKKHVLDNISFSVRKGTLTGIEGENGSGKTTLLNIMAGFWKADRGKMDVRGKIGFCPQAPMLFMQLSAEENIRLFSRAYGLDKSRDTVFQKRIEELTTVFRYNEALSQKCFRLSGGTLQKLNLMIALLHDPDVLLLDEPYAAFDWETYLAFWKYAEELKGKGKTIIVISHIVYERDKFDQLLTLDKGRIS